MFRTNGYSDVSTLDDVAYETDSNKVAVAQPVHTNTVV